MSFSSAGGANSAPQNPLAGYEGPLEAREREGKREEEEMN